MSPASHFQHLRTAQANCSNAENGLVAVFLLLFTLLDRQAIGIGNLRSHLLQPILELVQLLLHRQHSQAARHHLGGGPRSGLIHETAV